MHTLMGVYAIADLEDADCDEYDRFNKGTYNHPIMTAVVHYNRKHNNNNNDNNNRPT